MVGRVTEHRVSLHARGCQGQCRPVADAPECGDRAAPLARGKAAPEVGLAEVRLQIIDVDPVLTQQCQHVLGGADEFGHRPVL